MKKLAIFAAAFVLTLGLAQCKKEQPSAQNLEGKTVHLTVNVGASAGSATNGSRADIPNPSTGHYDFKDGDKLYVGYNGTKVNGELTYNTSDNKFSGDITLEQNGNQPLHFYYLGGRTATRVDETQQYTVDISDQTSDYPVISYGTSTINYSEGVDSYTTVLLNQCALVEFTTNEIPTTTAVSISGMKNKVTVDFNGNTLTPSEERGTITLHNTESTTKRWAILLPDDEVTTTATAEGYEESESFTVPAVAINDYLTGENGASLELYPVPLAPTTITRDNTNVFIYSNMDVEVSKWKSRSATFEGITITLIGNGVSHFKPYIWEDPKAELRVMGNQGDSFTFTAPSGKKFTKIEINNTNSITFTAHGAWTKPANNKIEWNGTAANEVTLGGSNVTYCENLNSIVFTLVAAN